jgi:hypothetical protein
MKLNVKGMKHPDAKPPRNCSVKNMGKVAEYGVSRDTSAKPMEAPIRTRRGPYAAPIQIEIIVTNICATVCAVVIHAPSS